MRFVCGCSWQLSQLKRYALPWHLWQRWGCTKQPAEHLLIGFAEVEVPCSVENQTPVSIRDGKVNVAAMRGRHDIREGSHRGLCCRCVDDYVNLFVSVRAALFDAESVANGWRDCHDDAFNAMVRSGLDVASAREMSVGVVIGPKTKVVQECMLSAQFGVQRDAMCVQVVAEVREVEIGAVGEVEHVTWSIPRHWA